MQYNVHVTFIDALSLYARAAAHILDEYGDNQLTNGTLVHKYTSNTQFIGVCVSQQQDSSPIIPQVRLGRW